MQYPIPKRYREFLTKPFSITRYTALSNVSIKINKGDNVAFLGPNGAGKTTLLKLIGGLLYPTIGQIEVNGFDTSKNNLKARENVGFVLNEERSFFWRLTGHENLQFFGVLDNISRKELNLKIKELFELVELKGFENIMFSNYSSGMKQRLAIARGLISDSEILILDEPTRTLDPISSNEIRKILKEKIHKEKTRSLLIATHRLDEAADLCNKICLINKGQILYYGDTGETIKLFGNLETFYNEFSHKKLNAVD